MTIGNALIMALAISVSVTALSGCNKTMTTVDTSRIIVIKPPESLYNCPGMPKLPNPDTATNQEIARVILSLSKNNKTCKVNIEAIKTFIDKASTKFDKKDSK